MPDRSPGAPRFSLSPAALQALLSPVTLSADSPPDCQPAGVLVPVFWQAEEPHLLFTQRTEQVKHHRNQISFPGGVADAGDPHLLATALRETWEEIGLAPREVQVLGMLAPTATVTGFCIHPFVGVIPYPYDFRPNPREVARLFTLPLAEFFPPRRWRTDLYTYEGRTVSVCCWHLRDTCIWGATARLVLDLLNRLGKNPFGITPCRD